MSKSELQCAHQVYASALLQYPGNAHRYSSHKDKAAERRSFFYDIVRASIVGQRRFVSAMVLIAQSRDKFIHSVQLM